MQQQIHSRGTDIDTDKCVQVVGNRFNMVLVAAERAREIKRQNKHGNLKAVVYAPVSALLELQAGEVDPVQYLKQMCQRASHKEHLEQLNRPSRTK
jgi:DNA-directed RNA polymerase omega subunit